MIPIIIYIAGLVVIFFFFFFFYQEFLVIYRKSKSNVQMFDNASIQNNFSQPEIDKIVIGEDSILSNVYQGEYLPKTAAAFGGVENYSELESENEFTIENANRLSHLL